MSRGFDFDSFGMDDFRESDSYGRGRETVPAGAAVLYPVHASD